MCFDIHKQAVSRMESPAAGGNGKVSDSFTSMHDAPLHMGKGHGKGHEAAGPPEAVLREIDAQELNRMFVRR